jgi:hypothetical protein
VSASDTRHKPNDFLRSTLGLAMRHPLAVGGITAGLAGFGVASDALPPDTLAATSLGFGIASAAAQAWLTLRLLAVTPHHASSSGRARVVSLILLSIPTTAGILLGLVLLIVPGLYLAARWCASAPILIGTDGEIRRSIHDSWRMTRTAALPLTVCVGVLALPMALALLILFVVAEPDFTLLTSMVVNLLHTSSMVAQWLLGIAAYLLLPNAAESPPKPA